MDYNSIASFFIFAIINAFTPGPGNLLALDGIGIAGWKRGRNLILKMKKPLPLFGLVLCFNLLMSKYIFLALLL